MEGSLSFTFIDICMVKVENEVVTPVKSKFYIMYVDDVFKRRNENIENILFKRLSN